MWHLYGCINSFLVQHRSQRRSAKGTAQCGFPQGRSLDLRWFSQVEDLSFASVPILVFLWDQQGPGSTAGFSPSPAYLLSLYEIRNKWFSPNFLPSIFPLRFSVEFRLALTISSEWFWNICLYILLSLPRTHSDKGGVSVIPYPQKGFWPGHAVGSCRLGSEGTSQPVPALDALIAASALSPANFSPLPAAASVTGAPWTPQPLSRVLGYEGHW